MREKAKLFAKNNVPKPKQKAKIEVNEKKSSFGEFDQFELLEMKHEAYADEVDKIKRAYNIKWTKIKDLRKKLLS